MCGHRFILAVLLLIQLPASAPVRAAEVGPSVWAQTLIWEIRKKFLAPSFNRDQLGGEFMDGDISLSL